MEQQHHEQSSSQANLSNSIGTTDGIHDSYVKKTENMFGNLITHGNLEVLKGFRDLLINQFALFPQVFLRTNFGRRNISGVYVYINFLLLTLISGFGGMANSASMFTGTYYNLSFFDLFARVFLIVGWLQCFYIFWRYRRKPDMEVYTRSLGDSLLYPIYSSLSKKIGLKYLQSEHHFQLYIETTLIIIIGIIFMALGYPIGKFWIFCAICMVLQITSRIDEFRHEIDNMRDSRILMKVISEAMKSDNMEGVKYQGFTISKTEVGHVKRVYQGNDNMTEEIKELMKNQKLD